MKKYLLNVTFYAGSNDEEDTDKGLFLLCIDKEITETEIKNIFKETNRLLDPFNQAVGESDFSISYNQGLNINTLMEGVGLYTKGTVIEVYSNSGSIENVDNYYTIEQWQ